MKNDELKDRIDQCETALDLIVDELWMLAVETSVCKDNGASFEEIERVKLYRFNAAFKLAFTTLHKREKRYIM
jgi:hypothetical protein